LEKPGFFKKVSFLPALWHNPAAMSPRLARVLVGLAVGLALGLGYAWLLQPVTYYDTAPASLRVDYRTDYVLMVAQAYQAEGDLSQALLRLAALGPEAPQEIVSQATAFAEANAFPDEDRQILLDLAADLGEIPSAPTADGS
jgi:hypothetical protein